MKNKNGIYIIGVDHGYGNIKTANCCFPTGVERSDTEPTFKHDLLIYQGHYYQIGVGHKEYRAEKVMDEDYYILTLAAIARELSRENITQANVFLEAGLPLSWVAKQKKAFREYLLQKEVVEFTFRKRDYRIRIVGAAIYPQGYAAIAHMVRHFAGSTMLCDIGNGTMNILRTLGPEVDMKQMFTEKYGVQQCVLAIQEALMREHHAQVEEPMIHSFLRNGAMGIDGELEETMCRVAKDYAGMVFRRLREHGYDPRLMKLYVVGGGGCLLKNFFPIDPNKVILIDDICATAKGYEYLADLRNEVGGQR